jgi:hypothetical protein
VAVSSFNDSPPPVQSENGARTVCALLLALTLFGIIVTGFKIGNSSDAQAVGSSPVQGGPVVGGSAPTPAGSSATTSVTKAQLRRHFPLPPGAHRTRAKNLYIPQDEKAYLVRSRLGPIKRFYDARFTKLGIGSATTHGDIRLGGKIVGYTIPFNGSGSDPVSGYVSLYNNYLGNTPGVITIEVEIE